MGRSRTERGGATTALTDAVEADWPSTEIVIAEARTFLRTHDYERDGVGTAWLRRNAVRQAQARHVRGGHVKRELEDALFDLWDRERLSMATRIELLAHLVRTFGAPR